MKRVLQATRGLVTMERTVAVEVAVEVIEIPRAPFPTSKVPLLLWEKERVRSGVDEANMTNMHLISGLHESNGLA